MTEAGQASDPLQRPANALRFAVSQVVGVAVVLAVIVGLSLVGVDRTLTPVLLYAGFWLLVVMCFGRWLFTDPAAFVTIVIPAVVVATVGLVSFRSIGLLIAVVWLGIWLSALRRRLWVWWSRNVLRRYRPGSRDRGLFDAIRRIGVIMSTPRTELTWDDLWNERSQLGQWATPVTMPVIAALQSWTVVYADGSRADAERVKARLDEEIERWYWQVQSPFARREVARRRRERPTWGSNLEYEYPALEALLALGSAEEQHRIRGGAARIALDSTGLLTPEREEIVRRAEQGVATPEDLATTDRWLEELNAAETPEGEDMDIYRQFRALYSLQSAVAPLVWPLDAADAVYESARSQPDPREVGVLERMMVGVIGAERASQAEPIPVDRSDPTAPTPRTDRWAFLARRRPTFGFIAGFVAGSFAVGTVSYLAAFGTSEIDFGIPERTVFFVTLVIAVLVGMLAGTAVLRRGLGDNDEFLPFVVALTLPVVVSLTSPAWTRLVEIIQPGGLDEMGMTEWLAFVSAIYGAHTALIALAVLFLIQALYRSAGPPLGKARSGDVTNGAPSRAQGVPKPGAES